MSWKIEIIQNVAVVSMNSNKMNLMNQQFFNDLNDTLDDVENNFKNMPLLLTSSVDAFSAGLDITEIIPLFNKNNTEDILNWYKRFRDSIIRLFSFKAPIIAAVNGHAIAGGLVLAMCCDYRFVVEGDYKYGLNEITIGFPLPSAVAEIIKFNLGPRNAERAVYNGLLYSSTDSVKLGFFHELVDQDNLLNISLDFASQYNGSVFNSYVFSKKVIRSEVLDRIENVSSNFDIEMIDILTSSETKKTLKKILEKLGNS